MTIKTRIARLENQTVPTGTATLVIGTDADRERLAALLPGWRALVIAAPVDRALVEEARARGVNVTAQFVGGIDLQGGV